MPRSGITGSRIRDRRIALGIRQAGLAQSVGVSASYLNLIEHNRRRIGGKLLLDIAQILQTDAATLTEGAEAVLIEHLSEIAAGQSGPELDKVEDMASRFPGWSKMLVEQRQKIETLERTVETLTDRLTHDPFLSTSMHDVLTAVTAIRSTSSILVDGDTVDPEWQNRFHQNIYDDSRRLAETSQDLVRYLDGAQNDQTSNTSPQEELDSFLDHHSYHFPKLEKGGDPEQALQDPRLGSEAAKFFARVHLMQYATDAASLPLDTFLTKATAVDFDPTVLAQSFEVSLQTVFRRLASLPEQPNVPQFGLAVCDASGTLIQRKPVGDFQLPRFGAACALWPLFQAIMTPSMPLKSVVALPSTLNASYMAYAFGAASIGTGFDVPRQITAYMLLRETDAIQNRQTAQEIGITCRICPRETCPARREPSILINTF